MVLLPELYAQASQQNIPILRHPMPQCGSMSLMTPEGACFIGMDDRVADGGTQERVHLSHELGHCLTGSFYNIYATADNRRRHENRADKWAVEYLIPARELDEAVAAGYTQLWQLAEYFGVSEDMIRKALCWYVYGNMAAELYF